MPASEDEEEEEEEEEESMVPEESRVRSLEIRAESSGRMSAAVEFWCAAGTSEGSSRMSMPELFIIHMHVHK